jgi:hypothetical protein
VRAAGKKRAQGAEPTRLGWREGVALPHTEAEVDTGARFTFSRTARLIANPRRERG